MSLISKATIQEVNDKLDAISVVEEYVRLEKKGGRYWGCCPFHNEKTPSFTVDPDKKMYHCFGCGQGGGIINFIMEMDKLSFPEAIETLAKKMGIEIIRESGGVEVRDPEQNTRREELAELYRRVTVTFHHFLMEKPEGSVAKRYIISRGIDQEMIDRFRLGFAPADRGWLFNFLSKKGYSPPFLAASGLFSDKYPRSSFFSNRLMFPIADRQGKTVAFGGRILEGDKPAQLPPAGPKYINSRESDIYKKGQTLFAIDLALPEIRRTKEVYLAEGYMDVISLHQAGITNAVAPLGTAFTDDQARLLRRWAEKINLVFDSDSAGQTAAVKAIITCRRNGLAAAVVVPAEGGGGPKTAPDAISGPPGAISGVDAGPDLSNLKDPADILLYLGPEALQKRMKCFINDFEYLVFRSKFLYDVSGSEGKARAVAFLFPYIETLDSDVSRDACIASVADAFGSDRAAVLNDYKRRHTGGMDGGGKSYPPGGMRDRTGSREGGSFGNGEGGTQPERPIRMNDELILLTVVLVNFHLYPSFRNAISIKEIEDPAAKELFIAMEESYIHEESGIDDLLSRISSPALRNYVVEKGTAGEFSGSPRQQQEQLEQLIKDGIKKVKHKRLRQRLSEITAELHNLEHDPSPKEDGFRKDSRLEELIVEKMHIDAELHR
ncbi:DNA primase [Spirochaetia bacterium]|nr:DNA primase [Spirochaetia bacterium]